MYNMNEQITIIYIFTYLNVLPLQGYIYQGPTKFVINLMNIKYTKECQSTLQSRIQNKKKKKKKETRTYPQTHKKSFLHTPFGQTKLLTKPN